jgi:hypothetical protein
MRMHRFSENVFVASSILCSLSGAATIGAAGQVVDQVKVGARRAAAVFSAAPTGSGTEAIIKIQESVDNSAWADVSGMVFTTATTVIGRSYQVYDIDLSKRKRYIRAYYIGYGGSQAGAVSCSLFLFGLGNVAPTQNLAALSG